MISDDAVSEIAAFGAHSIFCRPPQPRCLVELDRVIENDRYVLSPRILAPSS
jgi:hypothetical protein